MIYVRQQIRAVESGWGRHRNYPDGAGLASAEVAVRPKKRSEEARRSWERRWAAEGSHRQGRGDHIGGVSSLAVEKRAGHRSCLEVDPWAGLVEDLKHTAIKMK